MDRPRNPRSASPTPLRFASTASVVGLLVALTGGAYLLAWLVGVMAQYGAIAITIKTNTALCMLLLGVALALVSVDRPIALQRAGLACAAFAWVIGLLTLGENVAGWNLGIDQLLATEPPGAMGMIFPNRTGTPAAVSILLISPALFLLGRKGGRAVLGAQILALAVCLFNLLPLVGYLYGVRRLFGLAGVTTIAWPTVLCFLGLGAGVLLARPREGLAGRVTALDAGGTVLRRLLMPVILLPLVLGWMRLAGERAGWYDLGMGTAIMVLAFIVSNAALSWMAAERARRTANELAAHKELLAVTLTSIGDAVIACDEHALVSFMNPPATALTGWTAQAALGQPIRNVFRIINEQTGQPAEDIVGRVLGEGQMVALANHTALVTRQGRQVPIEDSAAPIRLTQGGIGGVVLVFHDVSDKRAAQKALRESEEEVRTRAGMLEAVLDTIADGVLVYDVEGRTVRSSPAADSMLGIPVQERKEPVEERVMRQYEILAEDGHRLEKHEAPAVRSAVHGETLPGALYWVRSGDAPPRWLNMCAKPLFVAGRHAGGVLSMTDMTERKLAEMELAFINRLYAMLSRVNEAIVRLRDERSLYEAVCRIVSEEGGFPLVWVGLVDQLQVAVAASWGPAADYLRGVRVEVEGELGQGPTGTCIRDGRPVVNDDFDINPATWPWREATRAHGLRASAAFPLRRGGATIGAITFYAAEPGFFTIKQIALIESLCADVSYALEAMQQERLRNVAEEELRLANESLKNADRRKDEFLAMLSHELRNPLAPIRNAIYVLRHANPGREQTLQAQDIIERQAEQLARIVDDLLDVTRIARGKIELRRSRVDLKDLVARAGDDFRGLMQDRSLGFQVVLPTGNLWADADPARITQVIGNLLHNAAKFTREGDGVTLSLSVLYGSAEISVRDTGSGIDPELLPEIFEPFVQGNRSLARSEGGLGLGLALVKGLTEMHGGTAQAWSSGKGKGAAFTIRLPLALPAADPNHPAPAVALPDDRLRILVVDDNKDAAESMSLLLKLVGHRVEVAYDGPNALDLARRNPPDVVLCDLGLPGMDGYQVARALRAARPEGLLLIAVSGYALAEDIQRSVAAGFDSHIAKPPNPEEVIRQVTMNFVH